MYLLFFCIIITGCSLEADRRENTAEHSVTEISESSNAVPQDADTMNECVKRTPKEAQWAEDDISFDPEDTIYCKTFYDSFVRGRTMRIRFPDIKLLEEIEDYLMIESDTVEEFYPLADMFYDNRTIEMGEEELRELFYAHGFHIYFHNGVLDNLHIRLIEIQEINGLTLYPVRIVLQTWDDEYIYVQDITGPIPRKIESFLIVDDQEEPKLVVHTSGFSTDFIAEEELSFWTFRGSYWILAPIELDIDTSHAHSEGSLYGDLDRDKLFPVTLYRDGIVYRPSRQGNSIGASNTYRLGKMEEVEKNKSFRLYGIYENIGKTYVNKYCYIEFNIK